MSGLYAGTVTHARLSPRRHRLAYRIFMLRLDLDDLEREGRGPRLFGVNRFNLIGFHERDHGDGSATPLRSQVADRLAAAGLGHAAAHIEALAMPRILGRAFNPLTIYFCHDAAGALGAILYEVNNTFGERHNYMIAAGARTADGAVRQGVAKRFHVSPFMDMDLDYRFDVTPPGEAVAVRILVSDARGAVLTAAFTARRRAMTDAALLWAWLSHPWQTLGVLAAIHWEAAKIFLKGMGYRPKPEAPAASTTVGAPL